MAHGTKVSSKRKILRDSIQGLVKNQIRILCEKAGIPRISGLVYEEVRGKAQEFLRDLLRRVVILTQYYYKKTVSVNEVLMADEAQPVFLIQKKLPKCVKDVSKLQVCLVFANAPFERLIQEIAADFAVDLRFEAEALILLQYTTEQYLLKLLHDARVVMLNCKRTTLMPRDLQVVRLTR